MAEADYQLWSFSNALFLIILVTIVVFGIVYGLQNVVNIAHIKRNWSEYRCSPTIMPFAGLLGYNTAENFNFCMGKTFQTHANPYFSSFGGIMGDFTGALQTMFGAIGSLRNTVATLGGGINVIFQEFTERISSFFFRLRVSAIQIKSLIGRMYAILFSVMYMGLSGITGMTSFTNTFLFSFLDTFCFPKDTLIEVKGKGHIPIKDIQIGDVLVPTESRVTGLFRFYSKGQPMVQLDNIIVSTNHYVKYNDTYIKAGEHPDAKKIADWDSDEPLYCLNTHDNKIPIDNYVFLDYDETPEGDLETMTYIQNTVNGQTSHRKHCEGSIEHRRSKQIQITEYSPCVSKTNKVKLASGELKEIQNIQIGDTLSMGSNVIGLIQREVTEICRLDDGIEVTPSTLYWNTKLNKWIRFGEEHIIIRLKTPQIMNSLIVTPNSQIELSNEIVIRDYMELCSPDSEKYYSMHLESKQ